MICITFFMQQGFEKLEEVYWSLFLVAHASKFALILLPQGRQIFKIGDLFHWNSAVIFT